MGRKVAFQAEAERELREAILWYKNNGRRGSAQAFEAEINLLLEAIGRNPSRFRLVSQRTRQARLRSWPYSIYFAEDDQHSQTIVVAVFHGRRNPAELQRRLR